MKPHPTDGNLDAIERHLSEQEPAAPPPDDWDDEERAEAMARRNGTHREEW